MKGAAVETEEAAVAAETEDVAAVVETAAVTAVAVEPAAEAAVAVEPAAETAVAVETTGTTAAADGVRHSVPVSARVTAPVMRKASETASTPIRGMAAVLPKQRTPFWTPQLLTVAAAADR